MATIILVNPPAAHLPMIESARCAHQLQSRRRHRPDAAVRQRLRKG